MRAFATAALVTVILAGAAWAQAPVPGNGTAPQVPGAVPQLAVPDPAQGLLTDTGSGGNPDIPDPAVAALPKASVETSVRLAKSSKDKPTAGDVVTLTIRPPEGQSGENAVPEGIFQKIDQGPVELGDARVLWWKPFEAATGAIKIGVTSYKPGKIVIRAIPFLRDGNRAFATEPMTIEFGAVNGDKSKDDIYPPLGDSFPLWLIILLALLVLAVVLAALYYLNEWNKKRKSRIEELAMAPKILSPVEEFEKVRRESDARGHLGRGNFKPHYFALSDGAKRFLGKAYRFDAEERTTRELLVELERLGMSVEMLDQWERVFDEMDVVKFTDQVPQVDQANALGPRLSQLVSQSWAKSPAYRDLLAEQQEKQKKGAAKA